MIDFKALFKITYGLYVVCSGDESKGNGFISNTVFQITSEPPQFAASCSKDNFTCNLIERTGSFSVSILHQDASAGLIGKFGYRSGKDHGKIDGTNVKYGETGVPIVLDDSIAYMECKVVQKIDMGSHILFIGELVDARLLIDDKEPLTYAYYRKVKKGVAPKNAPTYIDKSKLEEKVAEKKWDNYKCAACGYVYEADKEGVAFEDLPDDWTCPVCGSEKEDFIKVE
ncbi:flavin reductase [Bacteroidota bacterium]